MTEETSIINKLRNILNEHGHLEKSIWSLTDNCDLYEAGMNSSANVNVMFAIEDEFGITFPEHMLERNMFRKISSIHAAVLQIINMHEGLHRSDKSRSNG